jgi:2-oxoglutarate dehydrogenase E2 component (dihydrolipoamide succinyltransferase)
MVEIKVPELAESITEGTIAQWLKQPGDAVKKGEYLLEVETDKVNVELTAEFSGVLKELLKESGDTVEVGETIGLIDENGEATSSEPEQAKNEQVEQKVEEASAQQIDAVEKEDDKKQLTIASPAARKLARERGIDLQQVQVIDPLGRVRKQDVEAHSNQVPVVNSVQNEQAKPAAQAPVKQAVAQQEQPGKPVERIKMSRRRQTIANRLVEVQQTAAMLTTFNEVDMTAIMDVRKRRKDKFLEQHDVRLGFMSFFTKAVVSALKQYPLLNAEIQGNEIVMKKFYDIGIAVSAPEGLVVPVVRDADRLNFAGIESEILNLGTKARDNKLGLADIQGGTFTITNGGVFGSLLSTPILNGPQVGILGMHKIQTRPVAIDAERMENRPMMYIALSYDHRIVDGKEAVSFLATVKELLEDPEALLLEG